jgi:hypothetical protein
VRPATTRTSTLVARPHVGIGAQIQSPALVTGLVAVLYLGLLIWLWYHFDSDALRFVHIGTYFTQHDPNGTRGYDGQFYYYTAIDPLNAASLMDNATFRLQRVFYPLLVLVLAVGQTAFVPLAMMFVNLLAIIGGTGIVACLLRRWGRSPWFALSYALASGMPVALQCDTAEPLTFALVALGVLCWDRVRALRDTNTPPPAPAPRAHLAGALAFTAALLTRELAMFAVAGYGVAAVARRDWRTLAWAAASFAPLVLWSAYLSISSNYLGISYAQPLEHIPFLAYWLGGNLGDPTLRSAGYAAQYIVPTVTFGALGGVALLRTWRAPSPLLIGLLGNVYLLTFLHDGGYLQQVAPSRYALGLALAAVLWAGSRAPRWYLWLTPLCALSILGYLYGLLTQDPAYLW